MNDPNADAEDEDFIEEAETLLDSLRYSLKTGKCFYICKARPKSSAALLVPRSTVAPQSDQTEPFEEKALVTRGESS